MIPEKEILRTLVQFLWRVELKGNEVPAYNVVTNYLNNKLKDLDNPNKEVEPMV